MPPFDSAIEPGWGWLMEFGRERPPAMTVSARSGLAELHEPGYLACVVITLCLRLSGSVVLRSVPLLAERVIGGVA